MQIGARVTYFIGPRISSSKEHVRGLPVAALHRCTPLSSAQHLTQHLKAVVHRLGQADFCQAAHQLALQHPPSENCFCKLAQSFSPRSALELIESIQTNCSNLEPQSKCRLLSLKNAPKTSDKDASGTGYLMSPYLHIHGL